MRRCFVRAAVAGAVVWPALLACAGASAAVPAANGARAAMTGGTWGSAQRIRGLAALNLGGYSPVTSVSCASAGNCSAGGEYKDGSGRFHAFVASETHGTWHKAEQVPGTAALNKGRNASVTSVSCPAAGNCSAGGYYTDGFGRTQAFVVSETNGTWQTAGQVPGIAALNQGGYAELASVSCVSAGDCSAAGRYTDGSGNLQAFVVSQTNGTWHKAREAPGTVALNQSGDADVASVSCGAAGTCSAGGYYRDGSGRTQAFVISETNGTWGTAMEVPGTATLDQGGGAQTSAVSCASAGNCSAGGQYYDASGSGQAFVVSETNGTWHNAEQVPGTAALNQGGGASVTSVSCGAAGNCSAGGQYTDGSGHFQVFVVSETNGTWHNAEQVPGTAALNQGGSASVTSVSCPSAGNCSAGGFYKDHSGFQAFVVSETNGTWQNAGQVPGTAALNKGGSASVSSVSCPAAGNCTAGGYYADGSFHFQAFVVSET